MAKIVKLKFSLFRLEAIIGSILTQGFWSGKCSEAFKVFHPPICRAWLFDCKVGFTSSLTFNRSLDFARLRLLQQDRKLFRFLFGFQRSYCYIFPQNTRAFLIGALFLDYWISFESVVLLSHFFQYFFLLARWRHIHRKGLIFFYVLGLDNCPPEFIRRHCTSHYTKILFYYFYENKF